MTHMSHEPTLFALLLGSTPFHSTTLYLSRRTLTAGRPSKTSRPLTFPHNKLRPLLCPDSDPKHNATTFPNTIFGMGTTDGAHLGRNRTGFCRDEPLERPSSYRVWATLYTSPYCVVCAVGFTIPPSLCSAHATDLQAHPIAVALRTTSRRSPAAPPPLSPRSHNLAIRVARTGTYTIPEVPHHGRNIAHSYTLLPLLSLRTLLPDLFGADPFPFTGFTHICLRAPSPPPCILADETLRCRRDRSPPSNA
ncbi:hypothetical protein DFH08DRAFT_322996 [Mycena albidolilacea]|uniref:Uncharacterized protein n=1 Tax=Mycena albidolilacea TaxID=1033008 RepID=A0AAD7F313_9AGAR|nr:hypothetical protein DFH08DRAFT_322996 [Mycena albidolilacea]